MNDRSTQLGERENTASARQHASRSVTGTRSSAICNEGEMPDMQRSSSENETPLKGIETSLHAAPYHAATVGRATFSLSHEERERTLDRHSPSLAVTSAKGLVDIHAAAQFLAVSVSTLYGWVWQRRISFIKVGRAVRFDLSDLQRFVEENRIPARVTRKL
jgi:excisionase family DNA binding protein